MLNRLRNVVKRLENIPLSFRGFLVTLLCIIFSRNFLETFSDRDNYWTPVSFQAFFIHYPLFYLCVFVVLTIILQVLTREKIERIAKIMLCFFPLVLSAPVLDLVLSSGEGYNMSYLFGDLTYLARQVITFSWGYSGRGATPGIQIELLAVFALVGSYVFLKTGRMILTVVGMVACYFAIFVLGAMPSLVIIICNLTDSALSPVAMFGGEVVLHHFYSFNQKIFAISNAMLPSASDRESWRTVLIYLALALMLTVGLGLNPSVPPELQNFGLAVIAYLLFAFVITIAVDLFFILLIASTETVFTWMLGRRVQYNR